MEGDRRESSGGSRITLLALGLVGLIALAAGAYAALRGPAAGLEGASSARAGQEGGEAPAPDASMEAIAIPVEGMSCAACAASVKKALTAIDGVGSVEVDLVARQVRVRYVGEEVTPRRLAAAIDELGYRASLPEGPAGEPETSASGPRVKTTVIPVRGMACESCAATVEGLLRSLPGVEDARVSLEENEALVRYVDGEVTPGRLAEAIDAQGFEAGTPGTEGEK